MYGKLKTLEIPDAEVVHIGLTTQHHVELVHEQVTDVLYLHAGSITPLLDPTTGLPMTLTKYKELLHQK